MTRLLTTAAVCDSLERAIALGRAGIDGLNGPLSKTAALARLRAGATAPPDHSWLVEAQTKDGRRLRNGVRLGTEAEAEVYIAAHVPPT